MKVYTKKNNGLRLLGEGMVFSKGQLMLKEADGDNGNNALIGSATPKDEEVNGASGLETKANQELADHPQEDGVVTGLENITKSGQELKGNGVTLRMSQDELSKNKGSLDSMAQQIPGANVVIMRNQKLAAHKTPRKVMDEMRANSVPFTKTELTKFLKSI